MIRRAIISTTIFVALGAAALLMANAGSQSLEDPHQVGAIQQALQQQQVAAAR